MPFQFQPFPQLLSKRMVLRQATDQDLDAIFFLRSDAEMIKYINRRKATSNKEAEAFLEKTHAETVLNKSILWAISLPRDPAMVGYISLWNFSDDLKMAEVGYVLRPEFQHQGIMSEALQMVLKFGFEELSFATIEAFTHRRNEPSKDMLLKNGFTLLPGRKDEDDINNIVFGMEQLKFSSHRFSGVSR